MTKYIEIAKKLGCRGINGWDVMDCPFYERFTDVGSYIVRSNRMLMADFIKLFDAGIFNTKKNYVFTDNLSEHHLNIP